MKLDYDMPRLKVWKLNKLDSINKCNDRITHNCNSGERQVIISSLFGSSTNYGGVNPPVDESKHFKTSIDLLSKTGININLDQYLICRQTLRPSKGLMSVNRSHLQWGEYPKGSGSTPTQHSSQPLWTDPWKCSRLSLQR